MTKEEYTLRMNNLSQDNNHTYEILNNVSSDIGKLSHI